MREKERKIGNEDKRIRGVVWRKISQERGGFSHEKTDFC